MSKDQTCFHLGTTQNRPQQLNTAPTLVDFKETNKFPYPAHRGTLKLVGYRDKEYIFALLLNAEMY